MPGGKLGVGTGAPGLWRHRKKWHVGLVTLAGLLLICGFAQNNRSVFVGLAVTAGVLIVADLVLWWTATIKNAKAKGNW